MKLWSHLTTALAGLAALAVGLTAFGASAPIANSKHNMNLVFGAGTIQNNEICLPCHSAHSRLPEGMEFLWNHEMPTTEYKTYALTGSNATLNAELDEASLMCLSCHDGTVAVDSYYSTMGATPGNTLVAGKHKLGAGNDAQGNSTAGFVVGGGTGDLSHDHPVGIRYPGLSPTTGTWTKGSWRFKDPTKFVSSKYISANQTGAPAGDYNYTNYQKYDAATNTFSNISAVGGASIKLEPLHGEAYATVIGCVACHTPHSDTYRFLRIPNTNSQLCLTCHDK